MRGARPRGLNPAKLHEQYGLEQQEHKVSWDQRVLRLAATVG